MKLDTTQIKFKQSFSSTDLEKAKNFIADIKAFVESKSPIELVSRVNSPDTAIFLNSVVCELDDKPLTLSAVDWIPVKDVLEVIYNWIDYEESINAEFEAAFLNIKSKLVK